LPWGWPLGKPRGGWLGGYNDAFDKADDIDSVRSIPFELGCTPFGAT